MVHVGDICFVSRWALQRALELAPLLLWRLNILAAAPAGACIWTTWPAIAPKQKITAK
jgi:hypothetical protein